MGKYRFFFIIIIVCLLGVLIFLLLLKKNNTYQKNIAQLTPPPTQKIAQIRQFGSAGKNISFPAFGFSLYVPDTMKTVRELNAHAEGTEIGADNITLYTKDTVFDLKTNKQVSGTRVTIHIVTGKKDFIQERVIIPSDSVKQATTDASIIPQNNTLLTPKTVNVFSFPLNNNQLAYDAEIILRHGGNNLNVTFYCVQYVSFSTSCKDLLKRIFQQ